MHGARNSLIPGIAKILQPIPLLVGLGRGRNPSVLDADPKIGDFRQDEDDPVSPNLVSGLVLRVVEVHVDPPGVRVLSEVVLKVETSENLDGRIQPEASCTNTGRVCIPSTGPHKRPGSFDMVHPLPRSITHDLVDVENDGCCGAQLSILSLVLLDLVEEKVGCDVIIVPGLLLRVGRIDEREVLGTTGEEGIKEHRFIEGLEGKDSGELFLCLTSPLAILGIWQTYMLLGVQTVHPQADLFNEHLHEERFIGRCEVLTWLL